MSDELIKLDPANVPPELHFLIPFAEKWGVRDRDLRQALLKQASHAELEELNRVVTLAERQYDLVKALIFPPLEDTAEADAFGAMMMAAGGASGILLEERWRNAPPKPPRNPSKPPEALPSEPPPETVYIPSTRLPIKINPANVPPEFHSLIPYAEKWGTDDEIMAEESMAQISTEEFQEFLSAITQVGENIVRKRALKMSYDETQHVEGMFLLKMLMAAEAVEVELEWRLERSRIKIDPANVPPELHPLIPFAERWGIADANFRDDFLATAPPEILRDLVQTVHRYIEPLSQWLRKEYIEKYQSGDTYTQECDAFLGLESAAIEAKSILKAKFGEEHEL